MRIKFAKLLTKIGFLTVMAMIIAVPTTQGQSLTTKIKAHIPFDFVVGDQKLPAGNYSIGRAQQGSGDVVVLISSMDQFANVFRVTSAVQRFEPKRKGTLVFHKYGDQYFLFQVWPAGAATGRAITMSRREKEIQQVARGSRSTKLVEVVPIVFDLP